MNRTVATFRKESIDISEEVNDLETCLVCYCDYPKNEMFSLTCGHQFCQTCTEAHIGSLIKNGKAIKISCMESGCPEEFMADHVERFCSKE